MKKINIREALLEIDKKSYNQYDLTSLYEACKLDDKDKVKLVQYIDAYDHPSVIGGFLESKCKGVNESYGDDDVADIKGAEEIIKHINENEVPLFIDDDIDSEDNIANAVKPLTEEVVEDDSKDVRKYVWKKIMPFDNLTDDDSYYWEFEQDVMDGISAKLVSDEIDVPDNAHYKFSLPEVNLNFFFQDNPEYCYYVVDKDSVEPFSKEEPVKEAIEIGQCPICNRKFAEGELGDKGACPKCGEYLHKTDSGAYEKTDNDIDESKSISEDNANSEVAPNIVGRLAVDAYDEMMERYWQECEDLYNKLGYTYFLLDRPGYFGTWIAARDLKADNVRDKLLICKDKKEVCNLLRKYESEYQKNPHSDDAYGGYDDFITYMCSTFLKKLKEYESSKIYESKYIKEANKVAHGNEKYKGYMIRQDRKYGGYNVYDQNDEMEDSGFKTIDKAKEFIDSLSDDLTEDADSDLGLAANKVFEALKEYGAKRMTKYLDVYKIYWLTVEDDGVSTLVNAAIQSEGFNEVAQYGNEPNIIDYVNEAGDINVKLLIYNETLSVEISKEDASQYNESVELSEDGKVGTYAIVGWLSEHPQAYDDALAHFKTDDLDKVKEDDLVDWIGEHDQLYDDYVRFFKLDEDLDEGLWDDIKSVGKTVGKVAKKGWDKSYTKAVMTGLKKAYDKSDFGKATKEIGDSIKATGTYQKAATAVKGAKDFVKNNVGSRDRDPSTLSIQARGKNYRMSDLKYKDGNKYITPQEYASMGMLKRNKIRVIVPRGVKPITNESLYEAFNLTEDIDRAAIEAQIKSIVNDFMKDQGFDADEITAYSAVELKDTDNDMIQVEVRAELNYEDLMELADKLNPIVEDADHYAYFEPVTSGILRAFIRLDQSDDIVDEEAVEEWAAKINACKSLEELRRVYRAFGDAVDNDVYSSGTASAVCDIVHNKVDTLDEAIEGETQYGVHQFSTDSIIFRGTEEECGKYIDADKNLWDDAEVYKIEPGDKHYLNEDILDTPIEDVEKFVAQAKSQFSGSDAYFDGNTNQVVVKLDNSVNEDLDTTIVEDTLENYIIKALGMTYYTPAEMDMIKKFIEPYKEQLFNFEYVILTEDNFYDNDDLTDDLIIAEDGSCGIVIYKNVFDVKFDYITKCKVKPVEEPNNPDNPEIQVLDESKSINEEVEKVYTKKNGDYLTKCDNGGYSAFSASDVHLGHISDEDEKEASIKFEKNQFDESINESAISSVEPVVKFKGKSSHTFTPDKKWEVDFDEEGNILARTRQGKPSYFSGHINDKTNDFGHTDEDAIIQAAREQHKLKFGENESAETSVNEETIKMTSDELKDKFGTDDVDIINCGRPEDDGTVELKEFYDDDFSDEELASILGGDTKQEMPDGIETPEETEARLAT